MINEIFGNTLFRMIAMLGVFAISCVVCSQVDAVLATQPEKHVDRERVFPRYFLQNHYKNVYRQFTGALVKKETTIENKIYVYLTDGSKWEVLPSYAEIFNKLGIVGVSVYFNMRETPDASGTGTTRHLMLYNMFNEQSVEVALVEHASSPPLTVVNVEPYELRAEIELIPISLRHVTKQNPDCCPWGVIKYLPEWKGDFKTKDISKKIFNAISIAEQQGEKGVSPLGRTAQLDDFVQPGIVLALSNGSRWIIRDNYEYFEVGTPVHILGQEDPKDIFELVLITKVGNSYESVHAQRETTTPNYGAAPWLKECGKVLYEQPYWAREITKYWIYR